jgi:hypothetical protein
MHEARIEFTIGAVSFMGEGDKDWVAAQLDKILEKAPELTKLAPKKQAAKMAPSDSNQAIQMQQDDSIAQQTLPGFLQERGAIKPQIRKFLATAIWLTAKDKDRLATSDVTQALRESKQSRLSNASDCLNKNVAKGFCEKDGKEFFVTQEGKDSL